MNTKALSILYRAVKAVFALSLIVLFSLIILIPMPDAVLSALGWTATASGIATLAIALLSYRS